MTDTDRLIRHLAHVAHPVRPIASPLHRTAAWLAISACVVFAILAFYGVRDGLQAVLSSPPAFLEWMGSLLTGVLAAYATFQVSVPGRARAWAWLPVPALVVWMTGMGWGCVADAARRGASAFGFIAHSGECALAIALTSMPLAAVMLLMVRHAGVVRPHLSAFLAALSAASLSAASVSLYHQGDTALMVLFWHAGAVVTLSLASLALGRPLFAWIGHAKP